MRAIVEASPEYRDVVREAVETCQMNNATWWLLCRLVEEWAEYLPNFPLSVITLDVPIPKKK